MATNHYQKAQFLISAAKMQQFPTDTGYEVAFAGRSNAGKSSTLNVIVGSKQLARISKTPGRTQLLNFFTLDETRHFVDLPGYGYAKVPEAIKRRWQRSLEDYFNHRQCLRGIVLVMDIRHPMKPFDEQMLEWCVHYQIPLHILLNKADKLNRGAQKNTLFSVQQRLQPYAHLVSVQTFSALKGQGIEQARQQLDHWFEFESC